MQFYEYFALSVFVSFFLISQLYYQFSSFHKLSCSACIIAEFCKLCKAVGIFNKSHDRNARNQMCASSLMLCKCATTVTQSEARLETHASFRIGSEFCSWKNIGYASFSGVIFWIQILLPRRAFLRFGSTARSRWGRRCHLV